MSYGQTQIDIDSLLKPLHDIKSSKDISAHHNAQAILNFGDRALPLLANRFADTALTEIHSDCREFVLTKGEVAIIMADKIEMMPYALLTHVQNCTLEFCKDNPNLIEYYLYPIRRNGMEIFQYRYNEWLKSNDRKKYGPYLSNKKRYY
ncbi:hypothetical protein FPE01S_05_00530 [Flavihumibacter petaseus NBRC 106054]|uniref:Uncharacterized protein n=2 Tax=Flavihumibacter TaxID=1004301 RepID=A0A0E9N6K4_9BACT|nr:hypothetical protein FPE01S_05_00530 [Flavihumibacter petaseus NBRC 106054]